MLPIITFQQEEITASWLNIEAEDGSTQTRNSPEYFALLLKCEFLALLKLEKAIYSDKAQNTRHRTWLHSCCETTYSAVGRRYPAGNSTMPVASGCAQQLGLVHTSALLVAEFWEKRL